MHLKPRILSIIGVAMICFVGTDAAGQANRQTIVFDRNNPEILAFRRANSGGESIVGGRKVPSLALPVLDFTYPAVVGLGGFESGAPVVRELPVYDPRDPTTYSVHHRYGDVDITVSADLNIQGNYEAGAPPVPADGIEVEPASPGELPIARVTLYKFGIPYVIDIECGAAHAKLCRDATQLRALAKRLALVSVPKR
jgi:hypothetical protein